MDDAAQTVVRGAGRREAPAAGAVEVRPAPLDRLVALRLLAVTDADVAAAGEALGLPLATAANRWTGGAAQTLRLGPQEWLISAGPGAEEMAGRLDGVLHHASDVTPGRVAWRVSGPLAADLIASGCGLDLHPRAFPVGAGTRTLLAQVEVVVSRRGADAFEIAAERTLHDYLAAWLADAEAGVRG